MSVNDDWEEDDMWILSNEVFIITVVAANGSVLNVLP
jgi:hypothetical protein